MPFIPNMDCVVTKSGGFDAYGQRLSGKVTRLRCAIVTLRARRERTSVRTDSSASRSQAAEMEADARLLFPATFAPDVGDKVEVGGTAIRVTAIFPRYAIPGRLDHYEVDGDYWQEGA